MQRLRDFARLVSPGGFLLALASFVLASKLAFLLGPFAFLPVVLPLFAAFPRNGRRRVLAILMTAAFSLGVALNVLQSRGEEGQGTYAGLVIDARDSYFVLETFNGRYLVYEESSTRERFDIVKVEGLSSDLEMAHYESRFSFEEYLNKKGVYHEIEGAEITSLFAFPFRLRERGLDFLAHFEEETSHLIDSLLFGRSDSSSSTIALYEAAGALFYLSGSGTLLAAFLRAFEYVVRLRLDEKKSAAITLGLSLALSFLYPFKSAFFKCQQGLCQRHGYRRHHCIAYSLNIFRRNELDIESPVFNIFQRHRKRSLFDIRYNLPPVRINTSGSSSLHLNRMFTRIKPCKRH